LVVVYLAAVRAAVGDGFYVVGSFCFGRLTEGGLTAVEGFGFFGGDFFERFDEFKGVGVGSLFVEVEGFLTDGKASTTWDAVAVVVENGFEGAFVDDSLVVIHAGAFFSFESLNGDGTEFDAVVGLPRFVFEFDEFDAVKADVFEGFEKVVLGEGSRDTAAPEVVIGHHVRGDDFVTDDVRDDGTTSFFEDSEDFFEELLFELWFNEVENAVGDDHVNGVVRNERGVVTKFVGDSFAGDEVFDTGDGASG